MSNSKLIRIEFSELLTSNLEITKLQVRITTNDDLFAGTDDDVYFDIGIASWKLDNENKNDFKRGSDCMFNLELNNFKLTVNDILWVRLQKKGMIGVNGLWKGFAGDWKPTTLYLIINNSFELIFDINQWLGSHNDDSNNEDNIFFLPFFNHQEISDVWINILQPFKPEEIFAKTLRIIPNKALKDLDKDLAFITTPLFKEQGVSGWKEIPFELTNVTVIGIVIRPVGKSNDSFATIDLKLSFLEANNAQFTFGEFGTIKHNRFLRVEYRFNSSKDYISRIPKKGDVIKVKGDIRWDTDNEGWYEMHPLSYEDIEYIIN